MHSIGTGLSDVGRVREKNEDNMLIEDEFGLYVVSDGMGGHSAGEVASALATSCVMREIAARRVELDEMRKGDEDRDQLEEIAGEAVRAACREVYRQGKKKNRKGMGCTLTMLLVVGSKAVMAHVGDTRLYLCRDGKVSQLSTDHTMANELAIAGVIDQDAIHDHHYAHVLTRAVGTNEHVMADTLVMDILPGDRFVICSDGLTEYIESERWLGRQLHANEFDAISEELVSYANAAGGQDNITVLTVSIEADEPEYHIADEMSVDLHGKFDALESVFLFEGLSMELLTRVLDRCEVNDYKKKSLIISEGDPIARLMVVLEGNIEVSRGGESDGELHSGDHVGATTLLSPRRAGASLTALGDCRIMILKRDPFWKLVRERPWLGVGLLERLGRRLSLDLDRSIEQREGNETESSSIEPRERV